MSLYTERLDARIAETKRFARCLSAVGPCAPSKELGVACNVCQKSAADNTLAEIRHSLDEAQRLLKYWGFEVKEIS